MEAEVGQKAPIKIGGEEKADGSRRQRGHVRTLDIEDNAVCWSFH